ncbi:MAG: FG-GAP-like repeat-containing protein, partial [Pirellulales bacterium]|nr:FG-GAP-like repeat-containing protein [Pirellulales bacterium]
VYLNSGVDRFMEAAQMTGVSDTGWTWALKFGDLDNDGDEDLYVSNGMTREWFNSDLKNKSQEILDQGGEQAMDAFWRNQPQQREPNIAFENSGDLKFSSRGKAWGLDYEGVSFGAALGDLDQDGDLDLVVNNFEEPASVYRNGSTEGHQVKIRLQGVESNQFGIGATVRIRSAAGQQMRYLTLSRGFMSSNDPTIHFGLGADKVIKELTVEWPSGQVQKFENLDADHLYTITEPDGALPKQTPREPQSTMFTASGVLQELQHEENSFNDFERQPLLPQKLSQLGPGLAWGDIDSDGDDDLYVGGASGQPGRVVVCDGEGEFESVGHQSYVFYQDKDSEDMGSLLFDVDSDGDLDLYVVSGSVECDPGADVLRDRLYLNDGGGSFTDEFEMRPAKKNKVETDVAEGLDNDPNLPQGPLPDLRDSGSIVTAADFDQDGDLDLFVGGRSIPGKYPETPQSRLLRNDWSTHGGFTDVTDQLAPGLRKTGMVTSAIWSDADGDGDPDLLVTHDWGPVKLWKNNEGQLVDRTQEAQLSERLGWFNGIAARDLDNDGDIDYVVTNFGLNTKYHATADNPVLVYHGDFDGQGRKCLVEAHYEHDTLYPIRGKSCSTNAMPFVSEKLPTFKEFALASLSDIYTEEGLTQSERFEVNALESGVLINDGEARFHFKPLPRLAQLSPGFGVVLTEVDGDGNADMYLVQNFYSPQQETGRMDGGVSLLLKGNGDGTFHPVWPDQSGLVVPGDAKGLTVTDLNGDGWVDFVVSINDGDLLAFENRGCQDGRMFNVRLRGRPGNLAAVGARVRVEREDGTSQTAEVYAGSGYLSQSSSTLVFGLGQTGQVKRVEVRWPDGMVTSHPPQESAPMIIDHP